MNKHIQAKNITDAEIMQAIEKACYNWVKKKHYEYPMASLWGVQGVLTQYPPKTVQAKLASMVKRSVLEGCACGCRGDFTMKENNQ